MKYSIIVTITFVSLIFKSQTLQSFVTCGVYDKPAILKELNRDLKKSIKYGIEASLHESLNGDTVVYSTKNHVEGYRVRYIMNLPPTKGTEEKLCGFQEFTFDCSTCSAQHLKDVTNSYGFKKVTENKYLSSYFWKTELEVIKNPESQECLILVFRYVDKSKRDYKEFYHSLSGK